MQVHPEILLKTKEREKHGTRDTGHGARARRHYSGSLLLLLKNEGASGDVTENKGMGKIQDRGYGLGR